LHARVGRYASPDENAFFPDRIPTPILPPKGTDSVLHPNSININPRILNYFKQRVIPSICPEGDDGQYGSSSTCDMAIVQAMSRRIHYGKFVAEAKFRTETERFTKLIEAKDAEGIMDALTFPKVEQSNCERVREKAATYGTDRWGGEVAWRVDPDAIVRIYTDCMSFTKDVQVEYLLRRIGQMRVHYFGGPFSVCSQAIEQQWPGDKALERAGQASVEQVFLDVIEKRAMYGVVPIGNSHTGTDSTTVQQMLRSPGGPSQATVCGEVVVPDTPALIGRGNVGDIRVIVGTKEMMTRCNEAIKTEFGYLETRIVVSDQEALFSVSDTVAALMAPSAAVAPLEVLRASMCDRPVFTRCWVICRGPSTSAPTGNDRTVVVFGTKHEPGALVTVLDSMRSHKINMLELSSHPSQSSRHDFDFFVTVQGHVKDGLQKAFEEVAPLCAWLRVVGSYPANDDEMPRETC